jgi:hypothetical protein
MPLTPPRRALLSFILAFLALGSGCRKSPPSPKNERPSPTERVALNSPKDPLSKQIEALTGTHTRAVWSHHLGKDSPDPYCSGSSHQLHGIDTRDGLGLRVIHSRKNNYSRPLLTPDGERILFTRKKVEKNSKGIKTFDMTVMITDWSGADPQPLAEGYALDVWKDPATSHLWVYAARDVPPTHRISWAAKKLVRFRLDDPATTETVWDQTLISPDNTQLSADGKRASGQAPWPHGGQYLLDAGAKDFQPTTFGCWSGMAPDNSYVSWMLDGNHRLATLFVAAPAKKTWPLKFSQIAGLEKGEIYHPRWSNHAQFITLTGPYLAERGGDENTSVIGKGGRTAEIVIAKLNDTATAFTGSVTLTRNDTTDAYPDVWIAGGESATLPAFPQGLTSAESEKAWPASRQTLAYLWEDLSQDNKLRLPNGKNLDCYVEPEGPALFSRRLDMQLGSGAFKPTALAQTHLAQTLASTPTWTLEAALLPPLLPSSNPLSGPLLSLPGWQLELQAGKLAINGTRLDHPPIQPPAHLALRLDAGQLTPFLNGQPLAPLTLPPSSQVTTTQFGGGGLHLGLQGIALHTSALPDTAIQASHTHWQTRLAAQLENNPPRVRLRAKLSETTGIPTAEGIDPYTRAMIASVYEVEQVLEGTYPARQILVCHWAMIDRTPCAGFPRKLGESFELLVEPFDIDTHHPELEGQRVLDDTTAFDLEKWYDITPPRL